MAENFGLSECDCDRDNWWNYNVAASCASCRFLYTELWAECPKRNECHCAVRSINCTSFVTLSLLDARECRLCEVKMYCSASRIIAFSCPSGQRRYKNVHRIEPTLFHDTSHFVCNENFEFRVPTGSKFSLFRARAHFASFDESFSIICSQHNQVRLSLHSSFFPRKKREEKHNCFVLLFRFIIIFRFVIYN